MVVKMWFSSYFTAPKELLAVIIVGGVNFLLGYSLTFVTYMKNKNNDSNLWLESSIGSISVFTATFGVFQYSWLSNKYGRKISLLFIYIFYLIGVLIVVVFSDPIAFLISRSIIGIANAGRAVVILYTSEVTGRTRRGVYVSFYGILLVFGVLMTYITQFFSNIIGVGIISAICAILGCLGMMALPESKYWYIINGQKDNARKSILWFDPSLTDDQIDKELNDIMAESSASKDVGLVACLRQPAHLKQFVLATLLFVFRTGCGRESIAVYPADFFSRLSLLYDPNLITLLLGFVDLFVSVLCTTVVGTFKRRTLLIANASLTTVSLLALMAVQLFSDLVNAAVPWLPLVLVFCYTSCVMSFLFPIVSVLTCEIVSTSNAHRSTMYNASWLLNNLVRGVYTALFPTVINDYHIDVTLTFFLANNILLILLIKFFVVETANKPLHECVDGERDRRETNDGHRV